MAGRSHQESAERVSRCVTALLREQPFFGSLALRLPVRADGSRETLASDRRDLPLCVRHAGTYWYHAHHRSWEQVARGLVRPANRRGAGPSCRRPRHHRRA